VLGSLSHGTAYPWAGQARNAYKRTLLVKVLRDFAPNLERVRIEPFEAAQRFPKSLSIA